MNYFHLASDCLFARGVKDAAIYNAPEVQIYLLNSEHARLIEQFIANVPLEKCVQTEADQSVLSYLVDEGLGFVDTASAIAEVAWSRSVIFSNNSLFPPNVLHVDWNIGSTCDGGCVFCPKREEDVGWRLCNSCIRAQSDLRSLDNHIEKNMDRLAGLGINLVHVRGGNPLLDYDRLHRLVCAARKYSHLQTLVTSPASGREYELIKHLFPHPKISFNMVVLDSIIRDRKALKMLQQMRKEGVPFSLTVLFTRYSSGDREKERQITQNEMGFDPMFTAIYSTNDMSAAGEIQAMKNEVGVRIYTWKNPADLMARTEWNATCTMRLELRADGGLYPCVSLDERFGELKDGKISDDTRWVPIFDWWRLARNRVKHCQGCAIRLACTPCAATVHGQIDGRKIESFFCNHNPETTNLVDLPWNDSKFVHIVQKEMLYDARSRNRKSQ